MFIQGGWSSSPAQTANENSDKVAVLITQWGEPEGFDEYYRKNVVTQSAGFRTMRPNEPCVGMHVGRFPFAHFPGLLPFAVAHRTKGLEAVWDSIGFYRLSKDKTHYISIYDKKTKFPVSQFKDKPQLVKPAKDFSRKPTRGLWCLDPRDGTNYCEGVFVIGEVGRGSGPNPLAFPNGIADINEISYLGATADFKTLFDDQTPRFSRAVTQINKKTTKELTKLFGDKIDVRLGAYTASPNLMESEDKVAVDFAKDGFRKMVLTRETTDNNNYANNFMTRGFIEKALCKNGFEDKIDFQQVRQVGRTPEYNLALLNLMKPHFKRQKKGSEITVMYTTYGLPFPGRNAPGPFSTPHPWAKEVYHENAYNNYISFKRYAEAYFGQNYKLNFNVAGKNGDLRTDNYFSYGLILPRDLKQKETEMRYRTLRENIDRAKKEGRKEIMAVISHWVDNNRDTRLAVRVMQGIPLNPREDAKKDKYWIDWCEEVDSSKPAPCGSKEGLVHLVYTEAFDKVADTFAIGYAHRIRGGIERFEVLPKGANARFLGKIGKAGGKGIVFTEGELKGVRFEVSPDKYPNAPEKFTTENYRIFNDPADNFVSVWDETRVYVEQDFGKSTSKLGKRARVITGPIIFGPYRTLFNRPASITIPFNRVNNPSKIKAFIYNEASEDWDMVFKAANARDIRIDVEKRTATFDTQVLGTFVLAIPKKNFEFRLRKVSGK